MQASAADLTAREMSHSLLHSVSMSATSPFHKKGPIARVPTLTSVPSFDGEVVVLPELDTNRRPAATAHSLARDGAPGRVGRVSPPETARARDELRLSAQLARADSNAQHRLYLPDGLEPKYGQYGRSAELAPSSSLPQLIGAASAQLSAQIRIPRQMKQPTAEQRAAAAASREGAVAGAGGPRSADLAILGNPPSSSHSQSHLPQIPAGVSAVVSAEVPSTIVVGVVVGAPVDLDAEHKATLAALRAQQHPGSEGAHDGAGGGSGFDKIGSDESAEARDERLKRNVALLRRALATHVKRVMKLFEEWDEDGDGTVSKAEFRLAMRSLSAQWGLRVSREDIEWLFDSLDDSGDGLISYSELKEMVREERALLKAEREGGADGKQKKRVHTGADKQKPSVIKSLVVPVGGNLLDALREALERSGRRAIDLFRDWDADGTGVLSRDEFRMALSKLGIQPPALALADIDALFTAMDKDGDGHVEAADMSRALRKTTEQLPNSAPSGEEKGSGAVPGVPSLQFPQQVRQGLIHPLRSKSKPLPQLFELDTGMGPVMPIFDGNGAQAALAAAAVGRRSAAVNLGKLRSQLRGHAVGLDAQLTPRSKPPPLSQVFKSTAGIYADVQLPSSFGTKGGLRKSASAPMGLASSAPQPSWRRAPGGAVVGTDQQLPPTNDGALVGDLGAPPPPRPKRVKPWTEDKRCDPASRFFKTPNLDHLLYAEEA